MKKCDIIVPIYNAYNCLEPLIKSLIRNTDLESNRIILIDDKSSDKKVLPLLNKYSNNKNIILLKNDENLGFVKTVNKGMKYSLNDVVLLNSDTEVTPKWLEKIQKCAYSDNSIGTVTPLSNNATLVSVPIGLQKNDLPKKISLDDYAKLIESISYNEYPEIVTGHGFCLFIKRNVIDIVGLFDDINFDKGYGEENDFCFRCLNFGFRNVVCDNTIIYHKESQSFNDSKLKLIEEHSKIIENKYSIYKILNERWCSNFPLLKTCKNIEYSLDLYGKKNILFVIHEWSDSGNHTGGTSLHTYDIIKNLNNLYNFYVLSKKDGNYYLYSYIDGKEKKIMIGSIDNFSTLNYYNFEYKKMFENIIDSFNIGLVHVQHMIGHYFDLIDVLREKKIYSIISLHDYYSICPNINLLYNNFTYCLNMENRNCVDCLKNRKGISTNIVSKWQSDFSLFLSKFDKVIVPSNSTKEIVNEFYPKLKIDVIEHGSVLLKNDYCPKLNEIHNIAVVGVLTEHKGLNIFKNLVMKNSNKNVVYHLFGSTEDSYLSKNRKRYFYHGKYERSNLFNLFKENNIELVLLLSICPETFSYTLTETLMSKIPVLGVDIGAIGDRIKKLNCGWIVKYDCDSIELTKKIDSILNNENEYNMKVNNINNIHIKSIEEMTKEYCKIYNDNFHFNGETDSNITSRKRFFENVFSKNSLISISDSSWVFNTLKWRIISKIKVPDRIKNYLKRFLSKFF